MPFLSEPANGRHPASSELILKAQAEGAQAVHDGLGAGDSPYVGQRDQQGRFLALMWFRGYRAEQHRLHETWNGAGAVDVSER